MEFRIIFTLGLCISTALFSCKSKHSYEDILKNEKIYLVFRGTATKEGFLSREFNLKNSKPSHVGIAVFDNSWKIYHVLHSPSNTSALKIETFNQFLNTEEMKILNASVWEIKDIKKSQRQIIINELKNLKSKNVIFDRAFLLDNGSFNLYCSELVNDILHKTDSKRFNFEIKTSKLKPVYSKFLRRDSLRYYPVDVFQYNKNITLIKDWDFD